MFVTLAEIILDLGMLALGLIVIGFIIIIIIGGIINIIKHTFSDN